ncbi:MAG: transporter, partial [Planctomycetales bacterium 12-60-4]
DISIADFELNITNLVRDVEDLYWELYLTYRTYDAELSARDAALQFWRTTKRRMEVGARRGALVDEVQARENYFTTRIRVENALANLYITEGQLRRLLSLPVNDGRIIRPAEEPLAAEYLANWRMALAESLVHRAELRRQKWQIKSLELQLTAAKSLIKPRLDFVAGYQVNGFGDNLLSYDPEDGITDQGLNSAYTTLTRGDQTGWDLGFEMSLPIGLRSALATKRNLELRLTKARAVLGAQELEISHELSNSFQLVDWWYQLAETNFHRRNAALKETEVIVQEYEAGRIPVDLLLRSRAELAAADVGYYTSLVKYNQSLTDMRVRKGTLLEENSVYLAEGSWTPEAYDEAMRRAWARSYAI